MLNVEGSASSPINIVDLATWNTTEVPEYPNVKEFLPREDIPFYCNPDINDRLVIWSGELDFLYSHGLVRPLIDHKSHRGSSSHDISFLPAAIRQEIKQCRTGEAMITEGYSVVSTYLLHTLPPNYNRRYRSASECALYNCYRNCLQLGLDSNLKSLAFPPLHDTKRNYPVEQGAHIALRTLRRFMEKCSKIDRILIQVPQINQTTYDILLPLYFPRNKSEETFSARNLPLDIGNDNGEPTQPDRTIRIAAHPSLVKKRMSGSDSDSVDQGVEASECLEDLSSPGNHPFARMEMHPDLRRQKTFYVDKTAKARLSVQRRYDRLLRRSRKMDMTVFSSLRCLYQCGTDVQGRPIVVVVGKYFPALTINYREAILYFIHLMDRIVTSQYIVIYMHTETTSTNQPPLTFIKEVYNLVDDRYKRNLHAFYLVHCTVWARLLSWFFTTFTTPQIKSKIHTITYLADLYHRINPKQMDLPEFCYDYDKKLFGNTPLPHLKQIHDSNAEL